MANEFNTIKVLIWDFDGTLYKPNPGIWQAVREAEYETIIAHTGWSRDRATEEFGKLYKKVIQSATQVVSALASISIKDAAIEMESHFDRRDFLKRDEKLIALFAKLTRFRHIIFGNGIVKRHQETLEVLGIPKDTFELFVTSETVGVTKPNDKGFQYILGYTKLSAQEHMMIGDRESVDLLPAKNIGIKTCLVWSHLPSSLADVTVKTVYDVPSIFSF